MKKLFLLPLLAATLTLAGCGGGDESAPTAAVPFDRAFVDAMVPHHRSAIEMANAAKDAGLTQPELLKIANDIIATQQLEIDDMLGWRADWFGGEPESEETALAVLGLSPAEAGMEHDAGDFESVEDVDQAFAAMMIGHHEGAIRMAELAQEKGQHDEVKELAEAIISAQQREIDVMRPHAEGEHHG